MSDRSLDEVAKVGDRVRLLHMEDPSGPGRGSEGTVVYIGEVCAADIEGSPGLWHLMGRRKFWVKWDTGGAMALIEGVDLFDLVAMN